MSPNCARTAMGEQTARKRPYASFNQKPLRQAIGKPLDLIVVEDFAFAQK